MNKEVKNMVKTRLAKLIDVKSIITILLTSGFLYLTAANRVTTEQYLTVFTVVIAFYFGTQVVKRGEKEQ